MSEKPSNRREEVTVALEMKEAIIALAGPRGTYDNRESMIGRAARAAGITFGEAKRLFYCEVRDPRTSITDKVRAAKAQRERAERDVARNEYEKLLARVVALETALGLSDEDFHRAQIDALRSMAGEVNRALGRRQD